MSTTRLLADTPQDIAAAAELLRRGELVAFPTETVYGLAADATNSAAVRRIFDVKGRPATNPLIVHVADAQGAHRWARRWPEAAERLAIAFWPGPLTLVVPAGGELSREALAGGETVGLRAPDHRVAQQLLRACGQPLAAPSANSSGHLSPVDAAHVIADLGGRIAAVLDGGPCHVGIESTVIDLVGETPVILRPGMIGRADIESLLGREVLVRQEVGTEQVRRSPGMFERHYAPRVPLRVTTREQLAEAPVGAARVFLAQMPGQPRPFDAALSSIAQEYARGLYALLWRLQASGAAEIWLENPPDAPEWQAIHDRLRRAREPH